MITFVSFIRFLNSSTNLQTIAVHILPNISQSKGNQAMKFSQLIEYFYNNNLTREIFFFKNYAENEARKLVHDFFFIDMVNNG